MSQAPPPTSPSGSPGPTTPRRSPRCRPAPGGRRTPACCPPEALDMDPHARPRSGADVAGQAGRRPQPGAGGPRAQPGRGLRHHRSGLRPRLRPGRRRRADGAHHRPRRARARGTARGCCRRPSTPCGPTGSRARCSGRSPPTTPCAASSPTPGWAPDTAHRELDLDGAGTTLVKQVRLHTGHFLSSPLISRRGRDTMEVRQRAILGSRSGGPERGYPLLGPLPRLLSSSLSPSSSSSGSCAGVWLAQLTHLARGRRSSSAASPGSWSPSCWSTTSTTQPRPARVHAAPLSPHRQPVGSGRARAGPARTGPRERAAIIRDGLGVGIATGAYGISFGAVSVAAGLSVAQTCVLSLLMFTGASQFALVGVAAAGGPPVSGALTALLLGTRNTLYGLRLAPLLGWTAGARRRPPTCSSTSPRRCR